MLKIVNQDNLTGFLKDFCAFMSLNVMMKAVAKATGEKVEHSNSFNWIDDGKNDINLTLIVKDETKKTKATKSGRNRNKAGKSI